MRSPLLRWLIFRMRLLCVMVFILASLLPPYFPKSAQAQDDLPATSQQFLFVEDGFLMKQSSLGQQGSRLAYGEGIIHKVKSGDALPLIARRYGIKEETIRWANGIQPGAIIQPDQELVILPVDGVLHTVRRGQTLGRIAQLYEVSQEEIRRQNKLRGNMIITGQQIIIPGGKPLPGATAGALHFGDAANLADLQVRVTSPDGDQSPPQAVGPSVGAALTQTMLQMPCDNCSITQYFNARHFALDVQTRGGGPVWAAEAGTVIRADYGWDGGYGNVIEIDHGNGLVTLYGHNKELYVKKGDVVQRGQKIAWMGNSGLVYGPTGIHIHFEVRVNGVKKNPLLYME